MKRFFFAVLGVLIATKATRAVSPDRPIIEGKISLDTLACPATDTFARKLLVAALTLQRDSAFRATHGLSGIDTTTIVPLVMPADSAACRVLLRYIQPEYKHTFFKAGKFFFFVLARTNDAANETDVPVKNRRVWALDSLLAPIGSF